mgnify:CR=1 FL=1
MHGKDLEKILEYEIDCPSCRRKMRIEEYLYDMPMVGKVLIASGTCSYCGYKFSDVRLAEPRKPRKIVYDVKKPGDENALVIRASTASIKIPELGVEITPGPASRGYITTIEGIILDVIEKTKFLCSSPDAPKENCERKIRELEKARNVAKPFTIIIIDPEGVSAIISKKAQIIPLRSTEYIY